MSLDLILRRLQSQAAYGGTAVWTPLNLFSGGLVGAYYQVSDLSTLYVERSSPSTLSSVDGVVGTIMDKSGNGFHMIAASDAGRPILRQSGSFYYLEVDGVDDWMMPASALNLQEAWYHVGAWKHAASGATRAFCTSSNPNGYSAPRMITSSWNWYNTAGSPTVIAGPGATSAHALTIEQTSTTNLQARLNGVAGSAMTPYDDSAQTQVLALFTQRIDQYTSGLSGFFYGGTWARGALAGADRTLLETWATGLYS